MMSIFHDGAHIPQIWPYSIMMPIFHNHAHIPQVCPYSKITPIFHSHSPIPQGHAPQSTVCVRTRSPKPRQPITRRRMLTHSRTDLRAPRKNTRHGRPQKQERIERFQKDGAGDWWEKLPEPFDKLAQPERHQTPKTRKPFSTLNFSRKHKSIRMDTNARVQRSGNIPFFFFWFERLSYGKTMLHFMRNSNGKGVSG